MSSTESRQAQPDRRALLEIERELDEKMALDEFDLLYTNAPKVEATPALDQYGRLDCYIITANGAYVGQWRNKAAA